MKTIYSLFLLIFLIIISAHSVGCADKMTETEEILLRLTRSFNKINNYSAEVEMTSSDGQSEIKYLGKFYYQSPHFYRTDLYVGSELQYIIVEDGVAKFNYARWLNTVFKYDLTEKVNEEEDLISTVKFFSNRNDIEFVGMEKIDDEILYSFKTKMATNNRNYKYYLTKEGIIKSIFMLNKETGVNIEKKLHNIHVDTEIDQALFHFEYPNGVQVREIKSQKDKK